MTTRDEAAREFAEAMGWTIVCYGGRSYFRIDAVDPGEESDLIRFLDASAPLHEHLFFLGRVAEAVGSDYLKIERHCTGDCWIVEFRREEDDVTVDACDLSHAALLAGTAAVKARKR